MKHFGAKLLFVLAAAVDGADYNMPESYLNTLAENVVNEDGWSLVNGEAQCVGIVEQPVASVTTSAPVAPANTAAPAQVVPATTAAPAPIVAMTTAAPAPVVPVTTAAPAPVVPVTTGAPAPTAAPVAPGTTAAAADQAAATTGASVVEDSRRLQGNEDVHPPTCAAPYDVTPPKDYTCNMDDSKPASIAYRAFELGRDHLSVVANQADSVRRSALLFQSDYTSEQLQVLDNMDAKKQALFWDVCHNYHSSDFNKERFDIIHEYSIKDREFLAHYPESYVRAMKDFTEAQKNLLSFAIEYSRVSMRGKTDVKTSRLLQRRGLNAFDVEKNMVPEGSEAGSPQHAAFVQEMRKLSMSSQEKRHLRRLSSSLDEEQQSAEKRNLQYTGLSSEAYGVLEQVSANFGGIYWYFLAGIVQVSEEQLSVLGSMNKLQQELVLHAFLINHGKEVFEQIAEQEDDVRTSLGGMPTEDVLTYVSFNDDEKAFIKPCIVETPEVSAHTALSHNKIKEKENWNFLAGLSKKDGYRPEEQIFILKTFDDAVLNRVRNMEHEKYRLFMEHVFPTIPDERFTFSLGQPDNKVFFSLSQPKLTELFGDDGEKLEVVYRALRLSDPLDPGCKSCIDYTPEVLEFIFSLTEQDRKDQQVFLKHASHQDLDVLRTFTKDQLDALSEWLLPSHSKEVKQWIYKQPEALKYHVSTLPESDLQVFSTFDRFETKLMEQYAWYTRDALHTSRCLSELEYAVLSSYELNLNVEPDSDEKLHAYGNEGLNLLLNSKVGSKGRVNAVVGKDAALEDSDLQYVAGMSPYEKKIYFQSFGYARDPELMSRIQSVDPEETAECNKLQSYLLNLSEPQMKVYGSMSEEEMKVTFNAMGFGGELKEAKDEL